MGRMKDLHIQLQERGMTPAQIDHMARQGLAGVGHKGSTPTVGRRAETIAGRGVAKKVFLGERVLVVTETPDGCCPMVRAVPSMEVARSLVPVDDGAKHNIFWCETVDGHPFTPSTATEPENMLPRCYCGWVPKSTDPQLAARNLAIHKNRAHGIAGARWKGKTP